LYSSVIYVRQKFMARSTTIVKQKKMGRPASIGADKAIGIRIPAALLKRVDSWGRRHRIARSKAIRGLLERGLER
jgi:hypothetical protein